MMKIENGKNNILELHEQFEVDQSVHAHTGAQNERARPILLTRVVLRLMSCKLKMEIALC